MLNIELIREKPDWVKEQIRNLNDEAPIDEILAEDVRRREIIQSVEVLRQKRNKASKEIGRWMGEFKRLEREIEKIDKTEDDAPDRRLTVHEYEEMKRKVEAAKSETRDIGKQITILEEDLRLVEESLRKHMLWVPNIPHSSVVIGPSDEHNVIHEPLGAPLPSFDFSPKPHWDLGPDLDIIDFERGVKLSGTRFYLLRGKGALLQRALIQFMLNFHVFEHGYVEIYPPFMVRSDMFIGAAQLPKFGHNIYRDAEEDFMWLGTAEIALTNIHRDEILDEENLPLNYVAYTPCFRREKFSAGRDVRGIKRGHQFDKVEMYKFTTPEKSYEALEELRQHAAETCEALELPYRLVEMATGDLGFAAAKKYDLEVWASGCQEWLEVSSISNCEAFQARRANVRYRPSEGGRTRHVHTLNGSGLALPRIMIAILENNQRSDGTVEVPKVLRPYMGGLEIIE
jgi:seryl-tRNA synthetase